MTTQILSTPPGGKWFDQLLISRCENEKGSMTMNRNHILTFPMILLILLLFPIHPLAAGYDPIVEQIRSNTLTIIGETHKKIESVELFENLALAAMKHYQCVVIGLEIASDQQKMLDAVMQGQASVNEINLWPPVDHPPYRHLIEVFAGFKRQGLCIKVVAIDSGLDNDVDRDLWMALSWRNSRGMRRFWCCWCATYVEAG
jgi:hypothetical protein